MRSIFAVLFAFVVSSVFAQAGATIVPLQIEGLSPDRQILGHSILKTEAANTLVIESKGADGVLAFHVLHHIDGQFSARVANSASLPGVFTEPLTHAPDTRTFSDAVGVDRYWPVEGDVSPFNHRQYVTAVPLASRRFADVSGAPHPEVPPSSALLNIDFVVVDVTGTVTTRCRLEPNLLRRGERMTATSAQWVLAQGRPHLLVGMTNDRGDEPWPLFFRLYSPDLELVSQTEPVLLIDPNRYPVPILTDLTGDGEEEVIVISTLSDAEPVAILQLGPGDAGGIRVFSLNDCETRMNGADVILLQRQLSNRGYSLGSFGIDGWYGPDTRAAVVRFQRDSGIQVTGVADETTMRLLQIR